MQLLFVESPIAKYDDYWCMQIWCMHHTHTLCLFSSAGRREDMSTWGASASLHGRSLAPLCGIDYLQLTHINNFCILTDVNMLFVVRSIKDHTVILQELSQEAGKWWIANLQNISEFVCLAICPFFGALVLLDVGLGQCIAIGSCLLAWWCLGLVSMTEQNIVALGTSLDMVQSAPTAFWSVTPVHRVEVGTSLSHGSKVEWA